MSRTNYDLTRFGDVVREVRDTTSDPLANGLERYVGLEHIDPDSLQINRWGWIVEDNPTFTRKFRAGQLLFGRRRAYLRKAAVADFDGICSGDIMVFEPANDELLPELLPFIVQSDRFFEYAVSTSAGSLSPRTNWSHLANYEFYLPPLDEQRRIAEILWAVEEVTNQHFRVINAIKSVLEAVRLHKLNNQHHDRFVLADLCDGDGIQIGPFGSQLHASDYVLEGIPVIMPSDMIDDEVSIENISQVSDETAQRLSRHQVRHRDILLPRRGDLNRRAFVYPEQNGWICGTGSIRIRLKDPQLARAIFYILSSRKTVSWLERFAVGTTMPNLNTQIVSKIPISLPPDDELKNLVQVLEQLEETQSQADEKLSILHRLKKSLLKELLQDCNNV